MLVSGLSRTDKKKINKNFDILGVFFGKKTLCFDPKIEIHAKFHKDILIQSKEKQSLLHVTEFPNLQAS